MSDPWSVRPRAPRGSASIEEVFCAVGLALTHWEALESALAEMFDAMVSDARATRAAFAAFSAVTASSARTELITAAVPRALKQHPELLSEAKALLTRVSKFGARRNEIAHGRTFDLDEHGFYLCPSNLNRRKWAGDGAAKYQYRADDIAAYATEFAKLCSECETLSAKIREARGL